MVVGLIRSEGGPLGVWSFEPRPVFNYMLEESCAEFAEKTVTCTETGTAPVSGTICFSNLGAAALAQGVLSQELYFQGLDVYDALHVLVDLEAAEQFNFSRD